MTRPLNRPSLDVAALDLEGWLDEFDTTPANTRANQELPWIAAGLLIIAMLVECDGLGGADIGAKHAIAVALGAAGIFVLVVGHPAGFGLIVRTRIHLASHTAGRLGQGARWAGFILVNATACAAYNRGAWGVVEFALFCQMLFLVEAFIHYLGCRASVIDRVPVDSLLWMRKASHLFRAQFVAVTIWLAWALWPPTPAGSADDWTAAAGVVLAALLPVLAYTHRQFVSVEQWKREVLNVLDDALAPADGGPSDHALAGAILRLETLIVAGPAHIGPAVEPAIRRVVIARAVTMRRGQGDPWSAELTGYAATGQRALLPTNVPTWLWS